MRGFPPALRLLLVGPSTIGVAAFNAAGAARGPFGAPPAESPTALSGGVAADGVEYVAQDLSHLFVNNLDWKTRKEEEDADFFKKLGTTHTPPYLWIGCADARVPGNTIIGEDAGSVFTMRNVANMVVNTDVNLMSALQYAVGVLKVQHIIVCGHYECGGVKASMVNTDHGAPLENWLRNIRDVYRLHKTELDSIADDDQRHRRLVELNAVEQAVNVFKTGCVQRRRIETYQQKLAGEVPFTMPRVHAVAFDPATGLLKRLRVNFDDYIQELSNIYTLYDVPGSKE